VINFSNAQAMANVSGQALFVKRLQIFFNTLSI